MNVKSNVHLMYLLFLEVKTKLDSIIFYDK